MDQATLAWTQKMLADCEVTAPIDGVVLERNVEVGDFVAAEGGRGAMANSQFAAIADMSALRVEVDVSELDISRLRRNMPCQISPEAYKDRKYRGHIMWIDPGANYSKATVQVKVRIDNPDDYLRVEGSAQVVFLTEAPGSRPASQPAAIWVPVSAVQAAAGDREGKVFRVVDNRLRSTRVLLGRHSSGQIEVLSGLSDGDSIAADQLDTLKDGMKAAG
jgi:HlyD family secretion protein